ncbi:hypothetical protein O181_106305 [Austropuccinia psidii MF-1]|uniref:Integrase zinc-binding domain-containing protein n=1 Tax=Austropuccinia psidii MF-1 TaxID=1389203 RepID=A0A9Q3JS92_9BASI|nr:hypothetical protein [Austropuccinia psidii MF-1]
MLVFLRNLTLITLLSVFPYLILEPSAVSPSLLTSRPSSLRRAPVTHTFVMDLTDITLINTILHECHDSVAAGNLSQDRTLERVKICSWWPNWKKNVAEYCQTGDRYQKENRVIGKKFEMMIQIQEPKYLWEIAHMDWVTALPPGGDRI